MFMHRRRLGQAAVSEALHGRVMEGAGTNAQGRAKLTDARLRYQCQTESLTTLEAVTHQVMNRSGQIHSEHSVRWRRQLVALRSNSTGITNW